MPVTAAIAADTFAAAVAIGFQSRGEFGIGTPGALLDTWLGQQSDDVVLMLAVDPATATEAHGLHEVEADITGSLGEHRWGIRIALSGYPQPVEGSDAAHWIVDAAEVHAPALSLADRTSTVAVTAPSAAECAQASLDDGAPLGTQANPVVVETHKTDGAAIIDGLDEGLGLRARRLGQLRSEGRLAMADAGGSAQDPELFARTLEGLDALGIHAHTSDAVDETLGLRYDKRSVRLAPVRGTHRIDGSTVTMEASIEVVETDGREVSQPVLVTIGDVRDPCCSPVIESR